jgi:diacylglycerol kinase
MTRFLKSRQLSFRFALSGLWHVFKTQPNAWIHSLATILVISIAAWLKLPRQDWVVLLLCIGLVFVAEFFNTAIETLVDLASPAQNPLAKISKDVAAAAVLIAAFISAVIGFIIMGPPLWAWFTANLF